MSMNCTTSGIYTVMVESSTLSLMGWDPAPWKHIHLINPFVLSFAIYPFFYPLFKGLRKSKYLGFVMILFMGMIAQCWEWVEIMLAYLGNGAKDAGIFPSITSGMDWYDQSGLSRMFDVINGVIGAILFFKLLSRCEFDNYPKLPHKVAWIRLILAAVLGIGCCTFVQYYVQIGPGCIGPSMRRYYSFSIGTLGYGLVATVVLLMWRKEELELYPNDREKYKALYRGAFIIVWVLTVVSLYWGYSTNLAATFFSILLWFWIDHADFLIVAHQV